MTNLSRTHEQMSGEESFNGRFVFDEARALYLGIERECFITRGGVIVPEAASLLERLPKPRFSYELSACQLEERLGPCHLRDVKEKLRDRLDLEAALEATGLQTLHCELAPEDMPLDIFPDPTGRYQEIVKAISVDLLRAACRVAATHIHVGMPNREAAIRVHDAVLPSLEHMCAIGDHSDGERLRVYKVMARDWMPTPLGSWDNYFQMARQHGFLTDPRQCWKLIRVSVHGTIEFRMFGATNSLEEIEYWTDECHRLCSDAL